MPPKREGEEDADVDKKRTKDVATECCLKTPGPKYQLKPLVGFKDHCVSKYRNPAYTFGGRHPLIELERSPGPKYSLIERKFNGYSFGLAVKDRDIDTGPGPKYMLPSALRGPYYTIKWRTKLRKVETPGPYFVKPIQDAPAFSMGLRILPLKTMPSPAYHATYDLEIVKPKAPRYTIVARRPLRMIPKSPGPVYALPPIKPTPAYSFGIKHGVCAPPYITECDKQC